jgi:ornithine decarboxylase
MVGSYYEFDLDFLDQAMSDWFSLFPTIKPYYAVKCNPHPLIIERLVKLGAGFDCASLAEIQLVLSHGSSDILYANPCKIPADIQSAYDLGIRRTTFDSVSELTKLTTDWELMLRIRADDPSAVCPLGNKYGAEESEWAELLKAVKVGGFNLVGISFHVGSGARNELAYVDGVKKALKAVQLATEYGLDPKIIDIGGGFTHGKIPTELSRGLIDSLGGFQVIAEPGRYFAEKVVTLYTPVIGYKKDSVTIEESLYGAFNCRIFDHAEPYPIVHGHTSPKTLFGCTCDGIDVIYQSILLPELHIGDVLEWPNMGAYTMAATTSFNGIPFQARDIRCKQGQQSTNDSSTLESM